jgi:hypothetical protein
VQGQDSARVRYTLGLSRGFWEASAATVVGVHSVGKLGDMARNAVPRPQKRPQNCSMESMSYSEFPESVNAARKSARATIRYARVFMKWRTKLDCGAEDSSLPFAQPSDIVAPSAPAPPVRRRTWVALPIRSCRQAVTDSLSRRASAAPNCFEWSWTLVQAHHGLDNSPACASGARLGKVEESVLPPRP